MTQYARPASDYNDGFFFNETGVYPTPLYASIDETSPNDADYIQSNDFPTTNDDCACVLSAVTDPGLSTGHIVRVRYRKSQATGTMNLLVQLRQGITSSGSSGTLIAQWTYSNISTTFTTSTETLTGGQADAITDYTALALRFKFSYTA